MTTTATQSRITSLILPSLRLSLGYAEKLVADVPAEKFALCPVPNINHPAFCIGHLGLYADRIMELTGRAELARPDAALTELFKAGAPCVDRDPRYPAKDVLVKRFVERWTKVAEMLPEVPDERYFEANPMEGRMKEMMPTVGAMVVFMCGAHLMMHLGQISTWRRLVGLGPVN